MDPSDIEVLSKLHSQSPEIAQGVDSEDLASQVLETKDLCLDMRVKKRQN